MPLRKLNLGIRDYQWAQRQWHIHYGQTLRIITQKIHNGLIEIDLFYLLDMVRCSYMHYYICQVMTYLWMTLSNSASGDQILRAILRYTIQTVLKQQQGH